MFSVLNQKQLKSSVQTGAPRYVQMKLMTACRVPRTPTLLGSNELTRCMNDVCISELLKPTGHTVRSNVC
jgi:hypothetical protein